MEWTEGNIVYFSVGRRFGYWPVYKAIVGRNPSKARNSVTQYIYLVPQRIAVAVLNVERLTNEKERDIAHIEHIDMPDAVFVDAITAKKINSRRHDNADCQFKGCHDRYACIWFNQDSEKDPNGKRKPFNKIPKTHRVGSENCPRFFNRDNIKVVKHTKPAPPPPKPRPPLMFYIIED